MLHVLLFCVQTKPVLSKKENNYRHTNIVCNVLHGIGYTACKGTLSIDLLHNEQKAVKIGLFLIILTNVIIEANNKIVSYSNHYAPVVSMQADKFGCIILFGTA